jgi:uncharacterized membrane protein YfcA
VPRTLVLVLTGLAAGFLSALFGVGGGLVIVPALVAFCGFALPRATGTSLAAITLSAAFGAARYGLAGEVRWLDALLIGLPALLGVDAGVRLQQRVSARQLRLGFALLAGVTGLKLVVG